MSDEMYGSVRERELSGEVAFLREQVRALTAERDDAIRRAQEWQQAAEDLRAHAVELERALLIEREDARPLRGEVIILKMKRDAAQQRAKAVEGAVRRVTREALEALEKMPTPTKEHEALAKLQRNLLQRLREETDAAMAAATTDTEAP